MQVGFCTEVGNVRQQNQDSCGYAGGLFVVADGMGGAQAGEIASAIAVQKLMSLADVNEGYPGVLADAIGEANAAVFNMASADDNYRGMGTTIALIKVIKGMVYFAHIGDSRIYLKRDSQLTALTVDHSVAAELLRNGGITEEEALHHPQRHFLTRALGTDAVVQPEIGEIAAQPGDLFLLCTDGLSGVVGNDTVNRILEENKDVQSMATELVKAACEAGGPDNISVILVRITEADL
jgi:serine/threonine protein phosphatase PrpC